MDAASACVQHHVSSQQADIRQLGRSRETGETGGQVLSFTHADASDPPGLVCHLCHAAPAHLLSRPKPALHAQHRSLDRARPGNPLRPLETPGAAIRSLAHGSRAPADGQARYAAGRRMRLLTAPAPSFPQDPAPSISGHDETQKKLATPGSHPATPGGEAMGVSQHQLIGSVSGDGDYIITPKSRIVGHPISSVHTVHTIYTSLARMARWLRRRGAALE